MCKIKMRTIGTIFLLAFFSFEFFTIAKAQSMNHFAEIANRGPVNEEACVGSGGKDIIGRDYEYLIKAVPRYGEQVGSFGNVKSFAGKIYVFYGIHKGAFFSTTSIGICEFRG